MARHIQDLKISGSIANLDETNCSKLRRWIVGDGQSSSTSILYSFDMSLTGSTRWAVVTVLELRACGSSEVLSLY